MIAGAAILLAALSYFLWRAVPPTVEPTGAEPDNDSYHLPLQQRDVPDATAASLKPNAAGDTDLDIGAPDATPGNSTELTGQDARTPNEAAAQEGQGGQVGEILPANVASPDDGNAVGRAVADPPEGSPASDYRLGSTGNPDDASDNTGAGLDTGAITDPENGGLAPLPGEGEADEYGPLPGENDPPYLGPLPGEGEPEQTGPLPGE